MKPKIAYLILMIFVLIISTVLISAVNESTVLGSNYVFNPEILSIELSPYQYADGQHMLINIKGFGLSGAQYGPGAFIVLIDGIVVESNPAFGYNKTGEDQLYIGIPLTDLKEFNSGEHSVEILSSNIVMQNNNLIHRRQAEGMKIVTIDKVHSTNIPKREITGKDAMAIGAQAEFNYQGTNFSLIGNSSFVRKPYISLSSGIQENQFFSFNVIGLDVNKEFQVMIDNESQGTFETNTKGVLYGVIKMPQVSNEKNILALYQNGEIVSQAIISKNANPNNFPQVLITPKESNLNGNVTVYLSRFTPNEKASVELLYKGIVPFYQQQITVDNYGTATITNVQLKKPSFFGIRSFINTLLNKYGNLQLSKEDVTALTEEITKTTEVSVCGIREKINEGYCTTLNIITN